MDNKNKHIDDLFSQKANAHKADTNFAKMDFEAIKAKLPNAPAFVATPKVKPTYWFGLNTMLASVVIVGAIGFILLWIKGTISKPDNNNSVTKNNNTSITNDTLLTNTTSIKVDTAKIVSANLNQPKENILDHFNDSTKTKVSPKTNNIIKANDAKENVIITQTFFSKLSNASQFFNIDAAKDTTVICSNGTALDIKANSFTTQSKVLIKGMVQLEIKEAYNFTDVIANGLHMVSNSNLLASAGMIYMNAKQNNKALDINIRQPIQITMVSSHKKDGMQLFYLDKNANDNLLNTKTNWIANGQMQNEKNVFFIRNFGWLNSSQFNTKNIEKTSIKISLQNETDSNAIRAMLVFPKIKSVINLYYKNGNLVQQNLPIGEEAYLVSFKIINGKTLTLVQKITISKDLIKANNYKDIPIVQVKAELDAIGTLQ
jgi:hypothetical protein